MDVEKWHMNIPCGHPVCADGAAAGVKSFCLEKKEYQQRVFTAGKTVQSVRYHYYFEDVIIRRMNLIMIILRKCCVVLCCSWKEFIKWRLDFPHFFEKREENLFHERYTYISQPRERGDWWLCVLAPRASKPRPDATRNRCYFN